MMKLAGLRPESLATSPASCNGPAWFAGEVQCVDRRTILLPGEY
jgi:hypothetical protein